MWLLNARTVTLEDFFESQAPSYAILSHTWGAEEVSFQDIQERQEVCKKKKGYQKIIHTCRQALKDGLEYAWVDTCCIDKSSSSELSEAINSMFRWYGKAAVCYAFLADVLPGCDPRDTQGPFATSRWFTRGWTLQELLAPENIVFYASDWPQIASKTELRKELNLITGVDVRYLSSGTARHVTIDSPSRFGKPPGSVSDSTRRKLHQASVAERMSWASSRQTTRTEDLAYCLLGIFGISMPLIYGEGERAFVRLQEEIIKSSNDQSILAWGYLEPWKSREDNQSELYAQVRVNEKRMGVLAHSPAAFRGCGSIIPSLVDKGNSLPLSVTNKGLHICLPVSDGEFPVALLRCRPVDNPTIVLAVNVKHVQGNIYSRADDMIEWVDHRTWSRWPRKEIYLSLDEHLEEELHESEFSYPGSSIFIRHVPDTFSLQELSPYTRDMATSIFPPNYKTISPGLSPCTGNIALLFTSKQDSRKVALYFSLTKLPRVGASPLMMRKETFLMSVPCHLTNTEARDYLYHRSTWKNASNYIWCGADALYCSVTLQRVARVPLFVIDIRLSSRSSDLLWFRIQNLIPVRMRVFLSRLSRLWESLHFLFNTRLPIVIFISLAADLMFRLVFILLVIPYNFVMKPEILWLRTPASQLHAIALSCMACTLHSNRKEELVGNGSHFLAFLYSLPISFIVPTLSLLLKSLLVLLMHSVWAIPFIIVVMVFSPAFIVMNWMFRRSLPYGLPIFSP